MYSHLNREDRVAIAALLRRSMSYRKIALDRKVHVSTISREIFRNKCSDGVYRVHQAHKRSCKRRMESKEAYREIETNLWLYEHIKEKLHKLWSPEQIAGRLHREWGYPVISHSSIYAFVARSHEELKVFFRHKAHRRKHKEHTGFLGTPITERPESVEERATVGHWEGDTIEGATKKERIATHVERKSGTLLATLLEGADSWSLVKAISSIFIDLPVLSITYDNGTEFSAWRIIERVLNTTVYFAHPRSPGERGTNENTNGLLRQFFPKRSSFATLTQQDVDQAVSLINNRPRKRLGYRTPLEVLGEELGETSVAVQALI